MSHDPVSERARHLLERATATLSPAREILEVAAVAEDEKEHAKARRKAAAEKVKTAIRLKESQARVIRMMAAAKGPKPAPTEPEVYTLYEKPDAVAGWLAERKARVTQPQADPVLPTAPRVGDVLTLPKPPALPLAPSR
mgnify:FL=1